MQKLLFLAGCYLSRLFCFVRLSNENFRYLRRQDPDGLTASLVKTILAGVTAPATTEFIDLNQYQLRPDRPGQTNPVLDELEEKLQAADVWILGTPTYFGTVAGQFKQLLDCLRHRITRMTHQGIRFQESLKINSTLASPVVLPPAWTTLLRIRPMRPLSPSTKP